MVRVFLILAATTLVPKPTEAFTTGDFVCSYTKVCSEVGACSDTVHRIGVTSTFLGACIGTKDNPSCHLLGGHVKGFAEVFDENGFPMLFGLTSNSELRKNSKAGFITVRVSDIARRENRDVRIWASGKSVLTRSSFIEPSTQVSSGICEQGNCATEITDGNVSTSCKVIE